MCGQQKVNLFIFMTKSCKKIFNWTQDLSVGDPIIDEQHQQLLGYINELSCALEENKGEEAIGQTLLFLDGYINGHFCYEEDYMKRHGYPDLDRHIELHREFADRYRMFRLNVLTETVPMDVFIREVNDYIGQWWVQHIGKEDKKYHQYISQNKKESNG